MGASGIALMWIWSHWEKRESGGCGHWESCSGLDGKNESSWVEVSEEQRGKDVVGRDQQNLGNLWLIHTG